MYFGDLIVNPNKGLKTSQNRRHSVIFQAKQRKIYGISSISIGH